MHGLKVTAIVLLAIAFSSCTNLRVLEDWPQALPPQPEFVSVYQRDAENQTYQSDIEYLTWVVRFYEGWELMSFGWNDIVDSMLLDLDAVQSDRMSDTLQKLGLQLSA